MDSTLAYSVTEFAGFSIKGFWVEVDYKGQVGYVFSGYLSGFVPGSLITYSNNEAYHEDFIDYLLHNYAGDLRPINYGNVPDTCISNWSTNFANGITYFTEGACSEGNSFTVNTIEFENHALQEVYLLFLMLQELTGDAIWNKEKKAINCFVPISNEGPGADIGCEYEIYQKGNKVVMRRYCSC